MAKKEKQNLLNRFFQGWQTLLNGQKEQKESKAFPGNHFYSPEELHFISNNPTASTLDKWALAASRHGYEQSLNKPKGGYALVPVQWQDGLMGTWIDGKIVEDTAANQAAKLSLLEEEGYVLPQKMKAFLTRLEEKKLVGTYHSSLDGSKVIKVESHDTGHLPGEEASFRIKQWDKRTLAEKEEKTSASQFLAVMAKEYASMSEEDKETFTNLLSKQEKGKKEFESILSTIRITNPPYMGGPIEMSLRKKHEVEGMKDEVFPISWSLASDDTLNVHVSTNDGMQESINIEGSSAYRYGSLLETIKKMVDKEKLNGDIRSLVKILGVDFGDNLFYAKENNEPLLMTKEGQVNALIVTTTDFIGILSNNRHKVSLTTAEQKEAMQVLCQEGLQAHARLCNEVGACMMKDYVDSMKDKEDITSGDYELLPSHTKVGNLYNEYYTCSEELYDYTHNSLVALEDRAEQLADTEATFIAFKEELSKMIDAYNSHSANITIDDLHTLKSLNSILSPMCGVLLPNTLNMNLEDLEKRLEKGVNTSIDIPSKVQASVSALDIPLLSPTILEHFFGNIKELKGSTGKESDKTENPRRLAEKEKGEAVQRIDKRIHELCRQNKELSHNTVHGNSAEPPASRYSPEISGVQSAIPSDAKLQKGFVNSKDIVQKVALFLLNFTNNKEISANNFGKELIKSVQAPTNQLSDYVRFIDVNGTKTVLRLSDHSGNARNIIISGKKSDKGISLVIKAPSSSNHDRKFRANSWAKVTEYIYDKPDRNRLYNIGRGIFDLLDRGTYIDLADANEINVSPRKNEPKKLMTPDGKLLGATWRGKIYLSPEAKGFEPPVHEYTHLWAGALQDRNYKEWKNIVSMMRESSLWNEVRDLHTELIATDDIAEEVLATYSGRRGAERLESKFKAISDSNIGISERTAMAMSVNEVNNAVAKFWKVLADYLHIHYTSAEEVADRVLYDYTKGLYPYNYSEAVEKKGKTKPYYVSVESISQHPGRWHSPEVEERKAYHQYGKMLAERLSLQLTYDDLPWINGHTTRPCDLEKNAYSGFPGLMLALDTERNGYALPVYISTDYIKENGLLVKSDAISFPLAEGLGVKEVYNIEQTNYPIVHAQEFEALKLASLSTNRYGTPANSLRLLLSNDAWPSRIQHDGKQDLASYSFASNSIHIAPADKYVNIDHYYRDLSQGLVRSTRKAEAMSTKFESMVKEELVSLIGSTMIGQKEQFSVTTPQQSTLWRQRLQGDPSYTKQVLRGAEDSVRIIYQRINDIQRSTSQDLDLRSTTPVNVDTDGNGIIDSQENYAPDKKQGSDEKKDDVPRAEKRHYHR